MMNHCQSCGRTLQEFSVTHPGPYCVCTGHSKRFGEGQNPHKCPICEGHGMVPGGFYTALAGCGSTSNVTAETCRSCDGNGVLWR